MAKIFNNQEIIFIAASLLLILGVGWAVFYSTSFLLINLQKGTTENAGANQPIVKFNLKGLEDLGIVK